MLKAAVNLQLHRYTADDAREDVRKQRPCDWWVYQPAAADESPLLEPYRQSIKDDISADIAAAVQAATEPPAQPAPSTEPRMAFNVATKLNGATTSRSQTGSAGGLTANLSINFSPANAIDPNANPDNDSCEAGGGGGYMLPPEYFIGLTGWDVVVKSATDGGAAWSGPISPGSPVAIGASLGTLQFSMADVADIRAIFKAVNVPPYLTERVDPDAVVEYADYTITPAYPNYPHAYLGIAAAIEITHVGTGAKGFGSVHNFALAPSYLLDASPWVGDTWAVGTDGWIRQTNATLAFPLTVPDPAAKGLPASGSYSMRAVLLGIGYKTEDRIINALGSALAVGSVASMPVELSFAAGGAGLIPDWVMEFEVGSAIPGSSDPSGTTTQMMSWPGVQAYGIAHIGGGKVLCGNYFQTSLIKILDFGTTCTWQGSNIPTGITALCSIDSENLLAGTRDGKIYKSTNDGVHWTLQQAISTMNVWSIANLGGGVVIAATNESKKIYISNDYGAAWTPMDVNISSNNRITELSGNAGIILTGTYGAIHKSANGGGTWEQTLSMPGEISCITNAGGQTYLAGTSNNGMIYKSLDDGSTWSELVALPSYMVMSMEHIGSGVVLAGTANSLVFRVKS